MDRKRTFNVTAVCRPEQHYMVNLDRRLEEMRKLVDAGQYFTVNRARQYGKTTLLRALSRYLQGDYYVVLLDFQTFGREEFGSESRFACSFASSFLQRLRRNQPDMSGELGKAMEVFEKHSECREGFYSLKMLFEDLSAVCAKAKKPMILMIDEADSAADNQVFLDFLAQLRAYYIDRDVQPTFQSVILASVYDIKNLKHKMHPGEEHKLNSPWNIAADFRVEMSFNRNDIAGMLREYEADYHTGMDVEKISALLYDYTSGYPFLVSRLCLLMDEVIGEEEAFKTKKAAWTEAGVKEAARIILTEKNTLFDSLMGKIKDFPELNSMLYSLLFTGKMIAYNADEPSMDMAMMFGFIRNRNGVVEVANRIFETRLYNYYLSVSEMQKQEIYRASLQDKGQFVEGGRLDMRKVLERFVVHFNELYGDSSETFVEEEGRKYFLLYLRPIINGVGNYYIESRTRELRRTDVIVDYCGEQFVIELKIWHGKEYNNRGEKQLIGYLENYHKDIGYMVSFNFNKKKKIGVREMVIDGKMLIEAIV